MRIYTNLLLNIVLQGTFLGGVEHTYPIDPDQAHCIIFEPCTKLIYHKSLVITIPERTNILSLACG